jgi:hypothetical protein
MHCRCRPHPQPHPIRLIGPGIQDSQFGAVPGRQKCLIRGEGKIQILSSFPLGTERAPGNFSKMSSLTMASVAAPAQLASKHALGRAKSFKGEYTLHPTSRVVVFFLSARIVVPASQRKSKSLSLCAPPPPLPSLLLIRTSFNSPSRSSRLAR